MNKLSRVDETELSRIKPHPASDDVQFALVIEEQQASEPRVIAENAPTIQPDLIVRPAKRVPGVPREFTPIPDNAPAWARGWDDLSPKQHREQIARWCERLTPIALRLMETSGPEGFIPADVISRGVTEGILFGAWFTQRHPKAHSFSGNYMRGLASDDSNPIAPLMEQLANRKWKPVTRKNDRPSAKGSNWQQVYVHRRWALHLASVNEAAA